MARTQTRFWPAVARPRRWMGQWRLVPAFAIVGVMGGFVLAAWPEVISARSEVPASRTVSMPLQFPVCAGGARVTCVVDGDTFWLDGVKVRIADIDTPEVSKPDCAAEARMGRAATLRMRELLSEGPFDLVAIDRDEDVYGRKLRVVERNGQSLGAVLAAEGLAYNWGRHQQGWC